MTTERKQTLLAVKERDTEEALAVINPEDRMKIFQEANKLANLNRWGHDKQHLIQKYGSGMALRIRAEERELERQAKALDTINKQRSQWGLHPVHFVKRWDSRWDQYGNDKVPYSQEKLESQKGKYLMDDSLVRQALERSYAEMGWEPAQFWNLLEDWYKLLPQPNRFFQEPYKRSMRPKKASKVQWEMLHNMKKEDTLVVFEERNSHRMIRKAMEDGKMPFVKLPPPRMIWEPILPDCIIDDYILGQEDFTVERREGAILLRRWLPDGNKISCEVIGADYLNDVKNPTPLSLDWDQVERNGGFLIHNIMINSVDHHNNFKIVGRIEEAISIMQEFSVDPSVEFDPNEYMFFPYLWLCNPNLYLQPTVEEQMQDTFERNVEALSESGGGFNPLFEDERDMSGYRPSHGKGAAVEDYKSSRKEWRH
eukprot:TRINITY_DN16785_c0_g1_i1.p1 TRINITY_DN16785_c0_g1~~TRINITY_DN16785_c0_g1_i1.p1  ORF type:complete len:489 (+),score=90.99 TRINITY_DN16785_c0_g1_i1:195-1469(+)